MASGTLHDVSRLSGLSIATISKYLNGVKVKPQNKKRIEDAIVACNYSVNLSAKGLKTKRSMTIGVLIPNFASSFYSSIIAGVEYLLAQKGYTLFVSGYFNNEVHENKKFQMLVSRRVDAILIAPEFLKEEYLEIARQSDIPVLCFDTKLPNINCPSVVTDNFDVCKSVMGHILELGFENACVLLPNTVYFTTNERRRGCEAAIAENNAQGKVMFLRTDGDVQGAYQKTKFFLSQERRPDIIFALSSGTSLGALMAVTESGLRIPDDIAFIGYDNQSISKTYTPNISLVYQPIQAIAEKICGILEGLMNGEKQDDITTVISEIIYTESMNRRIE